MVESARQQLAAKLSRLRGSADDGQTITYRELAGRADTSTAHRTRAATGEAVPTSVMRSPAAVPVSLGADQPRWPRLSRGPRLSRWKWAAAAVVALAVGMGAGAVSVGASPGSPAIPASIISAPGPAVVAAPSSPALSPATAEITSPAGATVGFKFTVSGALAGAPPAGTVWELNLEMDDNRFYPLNRPCVLLEAQQFNCGDSYVGQEVMAPGAQYTVLVVDATPDAVAAFRQYKALKKTPAGKSVHGMTALPPGARIIGQKLVTRS